MQKDVHQCSQELYHTEGKLHLHVVGRSLNPQRELPGVLYNPLMLLSTIVAIPLALQLREQVMYIQLLHLLYNSSVLIAGNGKVI